MHEHVAALCSTAGFEPRIEQEANQNGSILALILLVQAHDRQLEAVEHHRE